MLRKKFHDLAARGGQAILRKRQNTTMGLRFPAGGSGFEARYEYKLYDGSAGIGLVLLDLALATKDARFRDLCDDIAYGLIESAPPNAYLAAGLYNGFSGAGLFHLARAQLLHDQRSLQESLRLGGQLAESPFVDTDLFRGAAGAGMFQIALYRATNDPKFLDGAKRAGQFLRETAIHRDSAATWTVRDPRLPLSPQAESYEELATDLHPGLAHGVAGICLFLVELFALTADEPIMDLYQRGFRWLQQKAVETVEGIVWPRSEAHPVIQNHWCHGAAGIAQAYLTLHRATMNREALAVAEAAGSATWEGLQRRPDEPSQHCHGFSGAIELFLDLASETNNQIWLERAKVTGRRLLNLPDASKTGPSNLGCSAPGIGMGTAGVIRQLLRLAGEPVYPILSARADSSLQVSTERMLPAERSRATNKNKRIDPRNCEWVPRLAVRFDKAERFLELGAPEALSTSAILQLLHDCPAAPAYHSSVRQVDRAFDELRSRHTELLGPDALNPGTFGPLLREISGLVLRPDANPEIVSRAARRMTHHSIVALETLLARLEKDRHGILAGQVNGRLTGIASQRSDPHRNGQRVIVLEFEDGNRLLYKSRPVTVDYELAGSSGKSEPETIAELCRSWLTPRIAGGKLATHRIFVADRWYGYAEMIRPGERAPLMPPQEFIPKDFMELLPMPLVNRIGGNEEKRFWYSAGLLAGHAFSFGMMDLHAENLVCGVSGSTNELSIHAVDVEVAFGAVADLEDTQLLDGPRWNASFDQNTHSHAGLHPSVSFLCGLHAEEWLIELNQSGVRPVNHPWRGCKWTFPHTAQNPDGSFGYRNQLCFFLRGFGDQWSMLQSHSGQVTEFLRSRLSGVPARVVCKPTMTYLAEWMKRKSGGPAIPGAAVHSKLPAAVPFIPAELRQLNQLDIPYFFRFLGEEQNGPTRIFWFPRTEQEPMLARGFPAVQHPSFFAVLERQSDPKRLARAVVDAVWAVAPKGVFDYHEPAFGVRVARTADDPRLLIILLLGERLNQRLTCRVTPEGKIEWWFDSLN